MAVGVGRPNHLQTAPAVAVFHFRARFNRLHSVCSDMCGFAYIETLVPRLSACRHSSRSVIR